jgi:hypothetical protein
LRKARILAVAIIAAFGLTAVTAYAANVYTVSGAVSPTGGTKKKPKPVALNFGYTTDDDSGVNLAAPVKSYDIFFEGITLNSKVVKKKCTAAAINAAGTDSGCPAAAVVGTGTVQSLVGTTGQPKSGAAKCQLALKVYNSGGSKGALFLKGQPPTCIAAISQAIDATYKKSSKGLTLSFTVPETLRHQLGLDISVTSVTSKIKKITGKIKGKKVGYYSSVGCSDKKRDIAVTFTDETDAKTKTTTPINKC